MKSKTTVSEVARNLSEFIDRVTFRGERFLLTRRGRPVAELSPAPKAVTVSDLPALLESLPRLGATEAESLREDLEALRTEWADTEPHDPWAS